MSLDVATEVGGKFRGLNGEPVAFHASTVLEGSRCSSRGLDLSWPATGLISSVDLVLNSTEDDDGDVSPEALLMPSWLRPLPRSQYLSCEWHTVHCQKFEIQIS